MQRGSRSGGVAHGVLHGMDGGTAPIAGPEVMAETGRENLRTVFYWPNMALNLGVGICRLRN